MDELYSPSLLVQILHSFPRTSLLYGLNANVKFSVTDTSYSHGLILAGIIPLLLLFFTMIGFLIYYNCIRFKNATPKEDFDNSACRCSMCVIGFFMVLLLCGVGAAVYGSIEVKNAIEFGVKSMTSVNNSLSSIADALQESQNFAEDLETKSLELLKIAPENENAQQIVNMTADLCSMIDNFPSQLSAATEGLGWLTNTFRIAEWYRSIINYSFIGLIGLVCFFALLGLLFRSRCCLISTTFFGQISLIVSYLYVGALLVLEIALSDLCMEPYNYIRNETINKSEVKENVFAYYMDCMTNENLKLPYLDMTKTTRSQILNITEQTNLDISKNAQRIVLGMHLDMTKLRDSLDLFMSHMGCEDFGMPIEEFVNSSCYYVFDGFLIGLASISCISFALIIILCAAPQAWKKFGQVDDFVDEDWEFDNSFRPSQSFRSNNRNDHSFMCDASGSLPKPNPRYASNSRTRKLSRRTKADSGLWDRPPPYS